MKALIILAILVGIWFVISNPLILIVAALAFGGGAIAMAWFDDKEDL